jgi:carboxyl-terminal processing protease
VEVELNEEAAKMPVIPEDMDNQLQEAIRIIEEK